MKGNGNRRSQAVAPNSWEADPTEISENWAAASANWFAYLVIFFLSAAFFLPTYLLSMHWFKLLGLDIDNLGINYMVNAAVGYNWQCLPGQPVSGWVMTLGQLVVLGILIVTPMVATCKMAGFESMKPNRRIGFVFFCVVCWLIDIVVYFSFVKTASTEAPPMLVTVWIYAGIAFQLIVKGYVAYQASRLEMKPGSALAFALLTGVAICTVGGAVYASPECSPYVQNSRTKPAVVVTPTPINLPRR